MDNTDVQFKSTPYRRRWSTLDQSAEEYKPLWRELNEYVLPWSGRFLFSDRDIKEIRRGKNVYNSVTNNAVETAASGLHGGLTSPSRPWFELTASDPDLMEDAEVKTWIYNLLLNERRVLSKSNFYGMIGVLYREMLVYGQGVMLIESDIKNGGIRCRTLTCGEYRLAAGSDLRINTLYRKYAATAAQLREDFEEKNLSQAVKDALKHGRLDDVFYIIHCIQPWGTFDSSTHPTWEYESVYFEESSDDHDLLLARRGYRTKPFVAVRWGVKGDDVYGYGPGVMSLSDIRQLQTQERAYVNAVNWVADPAWVVPTSLKDRVANGDIRPGVVVEADTQDAQVIRPLMSQGFDFNNIRQKIAEVVERIREAFYNPLFLMVTSRQQAMTATEVAQLVEEKSAVLGPVLESIQSEVFDVVIERIYDIMDNELTIIPPAPESLRGADLKVEYISLLAKAQRIAGFGDLQYFLGIAGQVIQAFPDSAKKLNADEIIDVVATTIAIPPKVVRTDREVEAIRKQEAQQMQQRQQMENIPAIAGAARDLSQAEPAANNALGMLAGVGGVI